MSSTELRSSSHHGGRSASDSSTSATSDVGASIQSPSTAMHEATGYPC